VAPIPPYYGTNGTSPTHPAPPSLTTTASSSLLLPSTTPALVSSCSAPPLGPSKPKAAAPLPVETSDLVGLNWRDKNYMGVVYTTNDDGTCDPLEVKHVFCFPYGCAV
jgi:hypothetical protein